MTADSDYYANNSIQVSTRAQEIRDSVSVFVPPGNISLGGPDQQQLFA